MDGRFVSPFEVELVEAEPRMELKVNAEGNTGRRLPSRSKNSPIIGCILLWDKVNTIQSI